jgi:hypothetical protein
MIKNSDVQDQPGPFRPRQGPGNFERVHTLSSGYVVANFRRLIVVIASAEHLLIRSANGSFIVKVTYHLCRVVMILGQVFAVIAEISQRFPKE